MIVNYVVKDMDGRLTLLITETSKVFLTSEFNISKEIIDKAQCIEVDPVLTIKEAKDSPKKRKISVEGKVVQVCILYKLKIYNFNYFLENKCSFCSNVLSVVAEDENLCGEGVQTKKMN